MTFAEIEQLARREIDDEAGTDSCRLVTSWQMLAYANEAEAEACIRARLLIDSTTEEICRISLTAGKAVYDYDPRIILILRGKLTGATKPLGKISYTVIDEHWPEWDEQTGTVEAFVTGMDKGKLRLFKIPEAAGTLNLTAARTPLTQMADNTDTPEISPRLHSALVYWMKHKVYNNQDSELFDRNRADVHLAMFEQKFGQRAAEPPDVFDSMQIPQYVPSRHCGLHDLNDY